MSGSDQVPENRQEEGTMRSRDGKQKSEDGD